MLNKVFHPDNAFFRGISKGVDVVVLGALWLLCSLPVITLGAATTALYYSMVKCVRRGEDQPYGNFFRCFRANFRVSLPLSLLTGALWYLLGWGHGLMFSLANTEGGAMVGMYIAYTLMLLVPLGVLCYAFPILSRFTLGPAGVLRTAFHLALRHLPTTVVLVLLLTQTIQLCQRFWYVYFLPLLLCPGVLALVFSLFLERIFRPLMPSKERGGAPGDEEEMPWYLR